MGSRIRFMSPWDKDYQNVIRLVESKYREKHRAEVAAGAKALKGRSGFLVYENEQDDNENSVVACFMLTDAMASPLFSEMYFDDPIEEVIATDTGRTVTRDEIVEVGSLASTGRIGTAARLLNVAPWLLWCKGFNYALITGTEQVRFLLKKLDIPFHPICEADTDRLSPEQLELWGSYYENLPISGWVDLKQYAIRFLESKPSEFSLENMVLNVQSRSSREKIPV